jgi:hypothetical protein
LLLAIRTFAIASFCAVALGCWVARHSGVPTAVWARNIAGYAAGALLAWLFFVQAGRHNWRQAALAAAPLALLLTFTHAGLSGVHRWFATGPLSWNASFMLLPVAVVALAAFRPGLNMPWVCAGIIQALLSLQPDASQATAFATACVVIAGRVPLVRSAFVLAAAFAWTQPDPLLPVAEVEGIYGLAMALSPLAAAAGALAAAAAALAPLTIRRGSAGWALAAYFLVVSAMPLAGAFPVPLLGMGMSPIIGFWLGTAALAALKRA